MILYDLKCDQNHTFEAWFKDSDTYELQTKNGDINCPFCGNSSISKVPMAPAISKKQNVSLLDTSKNNMDKFIKIISETCEDVGNDFANQARRIHYGEREERSIYGQATSKEANDLKDEGITFVTVPWIKKTNA